MRRRETIIALAYWLAAALICCAQPASAQPSIGTAAAIQNDVQGIRGSATRALAAGGSVFSDDRVKTGDASLARLLFVDQTTLTVAANSQAVLKEVYRPKQGTTQLVMKTVTGAFRFVSGAQSPHHYEVQFPQGYLTVRGTVVDLLLHPTYTLIVLVEGAITVVPYATRISHDLSTPGTSLIVHNDGRVEGPMTRKAALIKLHVDIPIELAATTWPSWQEPAGGTGRPGIYVAIGGGPMLVSSPAFKGVADLDTLDGPFPIGIAKISHGSGGLGLIAEGVNFGNGWRAELEESYRRNSDARFRVNAEGTTTVGVDRATFALMADIWRDFVLADRLAMHIGGGLGAADLKTRIANTFSGVTSLSSAQAVYQAGVGLDYATPIANLTLTLDYRVFGFLGKSATNVPLPSSCGVFPPAIACGDFTERIAVSVGGQIDQSIILSARLSFGP